MDTSTLTVLTPILLMAVFGVPHGALDAALIKTTTSKNRRAATFGGYIAIVVACIAGWYLAPTAAILLFLALSTWHFGSSDIVDQQPQHRLLQIIVRGGTWTLFLPLYHWSATEPIFTQLNTNTEFIRIGLMLALPLWILGCGAFLYIELMARSYKAITTPACVLVLCLALPPLWSLGLYFCFWHARRHTQQTLAHLADAASAKRLGRGITALTLAIAAVAFGLMPSEISLDTAMIRIFFVGIFALTVPHMILIDYYLARTHLPGTQI
ncbi:MAG: Brp/Blh family beta-carotene 15,15'-dioxygenase [Halieaceae bacterium]|nr:Brp/Blh family beta-carotene 15,15'-dioxygenase [Halieaceae bacterium]